jgi:hypothetical protein
VIFSDFWRLSKSISYVFSTRQTGSTPAASTTLKLLNNQQLKAYRSGVRAASRLPRGCGVYPLPCATQLA